MGKVFLILNVLIFFCNRNSIAQINYNYYISNSGSDTNAGTSELVPKQTIAGSSNVLANFATQNGHVAVGLRSGSVFNESLTPTYPIQLGVYKNFTVNTDFAVLNGSEKFDTGWTLLNGGNHTYEQDIQWQGFPGVGVSVGNYSYVVAIEIDRKLEQISPFSARKVLQFVPSIEAADSIPGSFFEPLATLGNGNDTIKIYIHTSNGSSPNGNSNYRYEVTVRNRAIDGYNNAGNSFENLWVRGYAAGYGLIPSGSNSFYNKVVFGPGTGIHHVVAKSGIFNNCLFLANANLSSNAVVFYDVQGMNRTNKISNSLFLDLLTAIYTHTSYGSNYNKLELENINAFADSNTAYYFTGASNTDTITLNNISTYGYYSSYNLGSAKLLTIKNSYFHYSGDCVAFNSDPVYAEIQNVYISGKNRGRCIIMSANTNLKLTNSILQVSAPDFGGSFISNAGSATNHLTIKQTIFIGKVNLNQRVTSVGTNTNNGIGTSSDRLDSNVYILVSGSIVWGVSNRSTNGGDPNVYSFSNWQYQSGQDQHSLFFDLTNDPRGLQAIFIDPDNGNYELANTVEGNQVRALRAGMTNPLHCFLKKPTYEEAADIIRKDSVLTAASCRNPCQQAKPAIHFSVASGANGLITVCQDNDLAIEGSATFLQNDMYYHQSDTKQRYLWWASDGDDTSGTYLHSFTHKFIKAGATDVRLQMVDENGCSYDTTVTVSVNPLPVKPSLGKDTAICTGQTLVLEVMNKEEHSKYRWSTGRSNTAKMPITEDGSYWVSSEDSFGCKIFDTIQIINKTPISVTLSRDTMYCSSAPALLSSVITGQVKSYLWNTGATTDTVRISGPGIYIVTAKDFGVCLARDTIVVSDNPVNLYSLPPDTTICEGTTYALNLTPPAGTAITWSDGEAGNSHIISGGTYSISAVNAGCLHEDDERVDIQPLPVVKLIADTTLCNGFDLPLHVYYPGANYKWSNGNDASTIIAHDKGIYWVQTSINGCTYRDSMELKLVSCDCDVKMPNAFSPNGDGINDVIRATVHCFPKDFNLSVFDRYGHLVHSSNDYKSAWDGRYNGKLLPVGTYYYILYFRNETLQQSKPFSGSITLLR